jgi:hypothetical protein
MNGHCFPQGKGQGFENRLGYMVVIPTIKKVNMQGYSAMIRKGLKKFP